jgi:hypothetical protein
MEKVIMRKNLIILTVMILSLIFVLNNYAQSNQTKDSDLKEKSAQDIKREASYYAPIRYVIVYNSMFLNDTERRIEILMDEKQFTESNLIAVFDLIKKRFPEPARLMIKVHTSLATIETPEEREMIALSHTSRFSKVRLKYKEAFFSRFQNGRESFSYTTSVLPNYQEKRVLISEGVK